MDRLTERNEFGIGRVCKLAPEEKATDMGCFGCPKRTACNANLFERLCSYEDTGLSPEEIIELAKKKSDPIVSVSMSLYDQEEIIEGCTVQVLSNSVTGDVSVGWWRGTKEDMPGGGR